MKIVLTVTVELERESGKFESKETMAEQIRDSIDTALAGESFEGENEGTYNVTDVSVDW